MSKHRPTQDGINRHMRTIRETIFKHGWMVQGVFATEGDPSPPFSYTIGLTEAGLPELFISGNMRLGVMQQLLNTAATVHLANEIKDGDLVEDVATMPLRARACGPKVPVQQARNYYGDIHGLLGKVRVIQLMWPDKAGAFPDTMFYDQTMVQELF